MNRDEVEAEVTRLLDRVLTREGRIGIITDYIMRLPQAAQSEQPCCDYTDCKEPVYSMLCRKHANE